MTFITVSMWNSNSSINLQQMTDLEESQDKMQKNDVKIAINETLRLFIFKNKAKNINFRPCLPILTIRPARYSL